jgi:hypothetical protein
MPTPSDPIRELVLQDFASSLRAINGTGVYYHALTDVRRGRAVPSDLDSLPIAWVDEGDEAIDRSTGRLLDRTLQVHVEVRLRSSAGDLPTAVNRMIADVERAMTADPKRSTLALRTDMVSNSNIKDEGPGVLASVTVTFEVEFFTARGNPASKG